MKSLFLTAVCAAFVLTTIESRAHDISTPVGCDSNYFAGLWRIFDSGANEQAGVPANHVVVGDFMQLTPTGQVIEREGRTYDEFIYDGGFPTFPSGVAWGSCMNDEKGWGNYVLVGPIDTSGANFVFRIEMHGEDADPRDEKCEETLTSETCKTMFADYRQRYIGIQTFERWSPDSPVLIEDGQIMGLNSSVAPRDFNTGHTHGGSNGYP